MTVDLYTDDAFPAVHVLALRGRLKRLPGDAGEYEAAGLIRSSPQGFTLTPEGHRRHRVLFELERASLDLGLLGIIYERFPAALRRLAALESGWHGNGNGNGAAPRGLVVELGRVVDDVEPILRRSAAVSRRFEGYIGRLLEARLRLAAGEMEYAFDRDTESIHTILHELHEHYLQTLGRGYE